MPALSQYQVEYIQGHKDTLTIGQLANDIGVPTRILLKKLRLLGIKIPKPKGKYINTIRQIGPRDWYAGSRDIRAGAIVTQAGLEQ